MIQNELADTWVETKTENGKCYYYNAKTRETTWTKPENGTILTQEQLLQNVLASSTQQQLNQNDKDKQTTTKPMVPNPLMPPIGITPGLMATNRFPPPFAIPPIHPAGFPFGAHPLTNPWINQSLLATTTGVDPLKQQLVLKIDTELRLQAAEWIEYKTPDGRVYYYNTKSQKSVWEKPEILTKFDEALEEVKKNEASKQNDNKSEEEVKDKSKPISSTPIAGTPWCVVWTGDNRVFFYNPSSKTSLWDCPPELKNRPEVAELTKSPPKEKDKESSQSSQNTGNKRSLDEQQNGHHPQQQQQQQQQEEVNKKSKLEKSDKQPDNGKEKKDGDNNKNEVESLAEKQRETLPITERIEMFKAMLLEKEVSAFSTWEKELHKIVFDQRYLLLTSKERKQVFEQFIKERAEEERKEKRQRQKLYREQYRQLLEQANLSTRTTYLEFSHKYGKDSRFKNIEKSRDRESLFSEFLVDLKRKERAEKEKQREKTKANFLELLKEQQNHHINGTTTWSEVKEKIRNDSRYKAVESSSMKEIIFKEFVSRLDKNITNVDEEISESLKEKEKQERIEASLREREKEVHRELAAHFRERDKERENHLHQENVESFNALLIDLIRSPSVNWREAKRILKKDHRWELVEMLSRDEMEQLFEKHVANLIKKKREKFHTMLDELKDINLSTTWKEVRRLIKDDSRYLKFSTSDRKCEREYHEYVKERLSTAKNNFKQLLQETKLLTYKTKQLIEESEQHLQDIINVLQNDKRYLILDDFADDRRQILINYISELHHQGPPKPITAMDPPTTRRK
ncbi:transcription elongation regulator 1-like [Dermatophagoides farinae]|uniref:Transcription elongation regulator 1-like n=1 Tax=Dermatophagoides farinae TaxID=6954 RepID=A0A9D4P001_DERFA|nr:transcription elongation regulator 1-like [Dermatophagoides farinae]